MTCGLLCLFWPQARTRRDLGTQIEACGGVACTLGIGLRWKKRTVADGVSALNLPWSCVYCTDCIYMTRPKGSHIQKCTDTVIKIGPGAHTQLARVRSVISRQKGKDGRRYAVQDPFPQSSCQYRGLTGVSHRWSGVDIFPWHTRDFPSLLISLLPLWARLLLLSGQSCCAWSFFGHLTCAQPHDVPPVPPRA